METLRQEIAIDSDADGALSESSQACPGSMERRVAADYLSVIYATLTAVEPPIEDAQTRMLQTPIRSDIAVTLRREGGGSNVECDLAEISKVFHAPIKSHVSTVPFRSVYTAAVVAEAPEEEAEISITQAPMTETSRQEGAGDSDIDGSLDKSSRGSPARMESCVAADYHTTTHNALVVVEAAVENTKASMPEALSTDDVAGTSRRERSDSENNEGTPAECLQASVYPVDSPVSADHLAPAYNEFETVVLPATASGMLVLDLQERQKTSTCDIKDVIPPGEAGGVIPTTSSSTLAQSESGREEIVEEGNRSIAPVATSTGSAEVLVVDASLDNETVINTANAMQRKDSPVAGGLATPSAHDAARSAPRGAFLPSENNEKLEQGLTSSEPTGLKPSKGANAGKYLPGGTIIDIESAYHGHAKAMSKSLAFAEARALVEVVIANTLGKVVALRVAISREESGRVEPSPHERSPETGGPVLHVVSLPSIDRLSQSRTSSSSLTLEVDETAAVALEEDSTPSSSVKVVPGEETIMPRDIDSVSARVSFESDKATDTAVNIRTSAKYAENVENESVSTICGSLGRGEKRADLGIPRPAPSQGSSPLAAQSMSCHASTAEHVARSSSASEKGTGGDGGDDGAPAIQRPDSVKEWFFSRSESCLSRSLLEVAVVDVVEGSLMNASNIIMNVVCEIDAHAKTQGLTSKRLSRDRDECGSAVGITDANDRPASTLRLQAQRNHLISLTAASSDVEPLEYRKALEHKKEPSTPPKSRFGDCELQSTPSPFLLESTTYLDNRHPKESKPNKIPSLDNPEEAVHDEILQGRANGVFDCESRRCSSAAARIAVVSGFLSEMLSIVVKGQEEKGTSTVSMREYPSASLGTEHGRAQDSARDQSDEAMAILVKGFPTHHDGGVYSSTEPTLEWLQAMEAEAKSPQDSANQARESTIAWVHESGEQAKTREDFAACNRKDLTWLTTVGEKELERTKLQTQSAETSERRHYRDEIGTSAGSEPVKDEDQLLWKTSQLHAEDSCGKTLDVEKTAADHSKEGDEPCLLVSGTFVSVSLMPNDEKNVTLRSFDATSHKGDIEGASSVPLNGFEAFGGTGVLQGSDSLLSADRPAPALWADPSRTSLTRKGSVAQTECASGGLGSMIEAGDGEWSRASLSRAPPFDALNCPCLELGGGSVEGQAYPRSPHAHRFGRTKKRSESLSNKNRVGLGDAAAGDGVVGFRAVLRSNADGSSWIDYFSPANQMAPAGDAYKIDSFRSTEASASTTIREDSAGSFICSHVSDGTDDGQRTRHRSTRSSDASKENCGGLGEVKNPAEEDHRRVIDHHKNHEETNASSSSGEFYGRVRIARSCKRWGKEAERSRQYIRQWEIFLRQAHQHFDGEAQLRKRLSTIRRAHPDVNNEVAFVALVQSHGRASEAAAILHLAHAKNESTLVTMILDVTGFIALAKGLAERRRQSQQLENQHGTRGQREIQCSSNLHPETLEQGECRWDTRQNQSFARNIHQSKRQPRVNIPRRRRKGSSLPELSSVVSADPTKGQSEGSATRYHCDEGNPLVDKHDYRRGHTTEKRSSHAKPRCKVSASAKPLLPPLMGQDLDTPPSPNTLKTIISNSIGLAPAIPKGFGLRPEMDGYESRPELHRHDSMARREGMKSLRIRAKHQQQKMTKMAVPKADNKMRTDVNALTDYFLRETRTLDRDSRYLDARLHKPKMRKGRKHFSSTNDVSWGQASSCSSFSAQTGKPLISRVASPSESTPGGADSFLPGVGSVVGADPTKGQSEGSVTGYHCDEGNPLVDKHDYGRGHTAERRSSHAKPRCKVSASAKPLLPPLMGQDLDTPPSPNTLKTIISNSIGLAPAIPKGFGLRPEMDGYESRPELHRHDSMARREGMKSLRIRAKHQQQKMTKMAVPKADNKMRTDVNALTDYFLRETRTLDRDSRYLDARLHKPKMRKGRKHFSSMNDVSWGQASSCSSFSAQTGKPLISRVVSPSESTPGGAGERESCRVQSYYMKALRE